MIYAGGFELPDHLLYNIPGGVWLRLEVDGSLTLGMAAHGLRRLGRIHRFSPRRMGQRLRRGMSCGTLESLDWVEPAPCPVAAVLAEVNPRLAKDPQLINRSPYAAGWLVRLWPEESLNSVPQLLSAAGAAQALQDLCRRERLVEGV